MLAQQILYNWDTTADGYSAEITPLFDLGYPAWTVKTNDYYGVALPLNKSTEINEHFSGAKIYNDVITFDNGEKQNALLLVTKIESIKTSFASLCAELIQPGVDGKLRDEIVNNPLEWWIKWKELLGNKNVDDMVYDVLGELYVLNYLAKNGKHPLWTGPDGATYDIDCDTEYFEVKSSLVRSKKEITLNNRFQLDPPAGKKLFIVLCQFEQSISGNSINSLVESLVAQGYSKDDLNQKLEEKGFEKRKSSRNRCYDLHEITEYEVDQDFPAIRNNSFVGGEKPKGVQAFTYTISLEGVNGKVLE